MTLLPLSTHSLGDRPHWSRVCRAPTRTGLPTWGQQDSKTVKCTSIQIYKTGGSLVFFEAEPHFGVKFIACLNQQPQNKYDVEPNTPEYYMECIMPFSNSFDLRVINLPSLYFVVVLKMTLFIAFIQLDFMGRVVLVTLVFVLELFCLLLVSLFPCCTIENHTWPQSNKSQSLILSCKNQN